MEETGDEVILPEATAEMTGYIEVVATVAGQTHRIWQQVIGGRVTGHVDGAGKPFELPELFEMEVVTGELRAAPQAEGQTV